MANHDVLQDVIDRIIPVVFDKGLAALTRAEQNVFLVWSYPAAIDNGGHASFFFNTQGAYSLESIVALREVGLNQYAELLTQAVALFPASQVPKDLEERNRVLESLGDEADGALEVLDSQFFELGSDAVYDRLATYWSEQAA